jgi:hypothetical protein
MTHLTADELIDAMEGMLAADRQAHLATCDACRRELAGLSSVLGEAKQASVPEPSPFFWQHFSARVNSAIDAEQVAGAGWPSWLRWQVLLPLGAVALIILGLMISVPKQERSDATEFALQAPEAPQAPPDSWVMLADLVGDLDVETAAAAGVAVKPGVAELAVLALTAEEQQELTRLLKVELMRAKS